MYQYSKKSVIKMSEVELIQGDCLEAMKSLPDKSVDMILCDLPYGTTACTWDTIIPFKPLWEEYNRIIKDNRAICLFGSEPFASHLRISNIANYKYDWIWNKKLAGNGILAKKQPLKIHEVVMVFNSKYYHTQMVKGKERKKMTGGMRARDCEVLRGSKTLQKEYVNDLYYPTSIQDFSIASMRKNRLHPTQKPVALLEYLIRTYTDEGETVLDNCMGSGSTGVACINTNRNFIGIELDETYFKIASERIHNQSSR